MSTERLALGKYGEQQAAIYLERRGYRIVARNYRTPLGEIDIVAVRGNLLVIAEVKTRGSDRFGEGYHAVNYAKQQKLRRLALLYQQNTGQSWRPLRFDVLSLQIDRKTRALMKLEHFEAAF